MIHTKQRQFGSVILKLKYNKNASFKKTLNCYLKTIYFKLLSKRSKT